jgi:hypothetical protein
MFLFWFLIWYSMWHRYFAVATGTTISCSLGRQYRPVFSLSILDVYEGGALEWSFPLNNHSLVNELDTLVELVGVVEQLIQHWNSDNKIHISYSYFFFQPWNDVATVLPLWCLKCTLSVNLSVTMWTRPFWCRCSSPLDVPRAMLARWFQVRGGPSLRSLG